jgi:DNA-directed RNA polymerase subunit RPC12/RpoP
MFKCPKCGKLFKSFWGLKGHYTKIHKQSSLECPVCHKRFIHELALHMHLAMKAGDDDKHAVYSYLEHAPWQRTSYAKMVRKRALQLLKVEERSA